MSEQKVEKKVIKKTRSSIPQPFRFRGRWRGQVTLANGTQPYADYTCHDEACGWINRTLTNSNSDKAPMLGGPTQATLCDMLEHYLQEYCLAKAGVAQEVDRANHYFAGAGREKLALVVNEAGQKSIISADEANKLKAAKQKLKAASATKKVGGNLAGETPVSFDAHNKARVASHPKTYALYARLAVKTANSISKNDMNALHTAMTAEGYASSTIQKEIALLKAMFNVAREKWEWKGFENPCVGIKLKAATPRFVVLTKAQRERMHEALAECDNPEFWPFVQLTLATTQRKHSLCLLEWERVDLENRVMQVWAKGRFMVVPLSKRAVALLQGLPGTHTGKVFSMTSNAVDCAWDGVRIKAGLPKLHFHDLRHVGATDYAREGMNSHQLKHILAHTTTVMSEIYVNLAADDIHYAMDKVEATLPQSPMPPAGVDQAQMMGIKKVRRLQKVKLIDPERGGCEPAAGTVQPVLNPSSNVVQFPRRIRIATRLPDADIQRPDAAASP